MALVMAMAPGLQIPPEGGGVVEGTLVPALFLFTDREWLIQNIFKPSTELSKNYSKMPWW